MSLLKKIFAKEKSETQVHIDLSKKGITLNGVFMETISQEKFADSEEELAQFPNLKKIDGTAILISPKIQKILKDKGIEILG